MATLYVSVIVLIPLSAVVVRAARQGVGSLLDSITTSASLSALAITVGASLLVAAVSAVMGTLVAWVLVRDRFPGQRLVGSLIDLPFALPTIVAGLTLIALYGPRSPVGVDVFGTRIAIGLALLFVTLPFVVRTVQPVLHELDREMEEAARSLGAHDGTVFRRIVLPNILPGILSGVALAFARAVGEIGAVVLIAGNLQVASTFIFSRVEDGDRAGASAVAVVLLVISFAVLLAVGGIRRLATRHERV